MDVGPVFEKKVDALVALESQHFEGGALGNAEAAAEVPPASKPDLRRAWLHERWVKYQSTIANDNRDALNRWY